MKKKILPQDLAARLMVHQGISKEKAEAFVQSFFSVIENALTTEKFVKVKGFGTFKLVSVGDRESININTGERFQINGHQKVTFTPDTSLKEIINRPFAHFEVINLEEDTTVEELESVDQQISELYPQTENVDSEENLSESMESDANLGIIHISDAVSKEESAALQTSDLSPVQELEENVALVELQEVDSDNAEIESEEEKESTIEPANSSIVDGEPTTESDGKVDEAPTEADAEQIDDPPTEEPTNTPLDETETNVSEEKNNVKVSEPMPITTLENSSEHNTSNMEYTYTEVPPRKRCNWWKILALTLLAIILMTASYFVGYYRLLCPSCHTIDNAEAEREMTATQPTVSATSTSTDSVHQKSVATAKPSTSPTDSAVTTEATKKSQPVSKQQEKIGEKGQQSQSANQQAKDKEAAKPSIVRHTVKPGENLTRIVRKYYGSDAYVGKVVRHNHLRDADNVPVGTVLELPMIKN